MNGIVRTIISLAIVATGVIGYLLLAPPEVEKRPSAKAAALIVKTSLAAEHNDGIEFLVDGVVVPFRQIDLAAQVGGRVDYKSDACRTGRAVKKGDLLFRIEQSDYEIEVKRLTEEVTQASAMLVELDAENKTTENQIASAKKQLDIDTRQLQRTNDLVARQVTSSAEADDARRTELNSRTALQTLEDQRNLLLARRTRLESAKTLGEANLEKASLSLERTEIRSPLDGVVIAESVEEGGFVQLGSTVVALQDTSQLDVACKLHMRQMDWLWQGRPSPTEADANLSAYDFPETPATIIYELGDRVYEWDAVVNRFDGAGIDNQTRMVPCLVNVPNPRDVRDLEGKEASYLGSKPPALMTGMFVKVRIKAQPPIPLVRLPQEAIQPGNTVWTVDSGKLKRKSVQIATSDDTNVIAYQRVGGLQAGDAVIVSPLATPRDGQPALDADQLPADYGKGGGRPGAGGPPGGPRGDSGGPPRSAPSGSGRPSPPAGGKAPQGGRV